MKKWKIILAVLSVMLLAGAGTLYYLLEVKAYETQDEKVDDVVEQDYDIALPREEGSTEVSSAGEGSFDSNGSTAEGTDNIGGDTAKPTVQVLEETNSGSGTLTSTTASSNSSSASGKSKTTASDKLVSSSEKTGTKQNAGSNAAKPTDVQIAAKYEPVFRELEAQANGKIDALVGHAFSEYQTKKQNGEEVSYFYFYSKYNTAGKILERKTDSTFNFVYNALVKELKDNGYDSAEAKKYKTAYEAAKKERRTALINKAKSAI